MIRDYLFVCKVLRSTSGDHKYAGACKKLLYLFKRKHPEYVLTHKANCELFEKQFGIPAE